MKPSFWKRKAFYGLLGFLLTSLILSQTIPCFATADSWNLAASMQKPRAKHTATLLPSGKVLVVGGYPGDYLGLIAPKLYDPAANTWSSAGGGSMFYTNFYYHTATLLQSGKVLVVGGMTYPTLYSRSSPETGFLNTAELYDPDTNTWSIASHLAYTRVNHTATLLPSGQVLVGGGNTGEEFNPSLDAVELYDPVTNSWHGAAHMLAPRQNHFAILLPSGKVLVGSGTSSEYSAPLTSTEIYDPVANTWSTGGTMLHSHIRATPILLPNSQVFVVAGDNSDAWTNAEIYNPQTNT